MPCRWTASSRRCPAATLRRCASAARTSRRASASSSFAGARAHGCDVLVLDEATSSIDTETEALVQRGIHVLMEGVTAIVIAHRLSTIQDVDRIYVLHRGRLVESGGHDELLSRGGIYDRLYRLQYASQESAAAAAAS
jgi:ATP-binding cassette subfamily B multidrug efflux pump